MTTTSAPPGPPGQPEPPGTPVPPEPPSRRPVIPAAAAGVERSDGSTADGEVNAWAPSNTPGWYRLTTTLTIALIVAFAAVATVTAFVVRGSSATIENNTAPSLVAVQDLLAGVAEANASATAVFLSGATGSEDRGRRNLYLDALERSARQTEEVAGDVGDDDVSHAALKDVTAALTTYSGEIEASRLANQLGQDGADASLLRALDLTQTTIAPAVATVTERSQEQFDRESSTGRVLGIVAIALGVLALLQLVRLQLGTVKRSNRVLNIGYLAATAALLVAVVLLGQQLLVRSSALSNAETGGYDSIASTSRLQADAFDVQSELSLRLLGTPSAAGTDIDELMDQIEGDIAAVELAADSDRERAAATELSGRWARYRATTSDIAALANTDRDEAIARFQGSGISTFNGLNTSIESVLSDNRSQFVNGVEGAADSVTWLPIVALALPLVAALAIVWGTQRRLEEYQ